MIGENPRLRTMGSRVDERTRAMPAGRLLRSMKKDSA